MAHDEAEKDPGLIFYFDDSQIIHQCLELPATQPSTHHSSEVKRKYSCHFGIILFRVGETERQSKMNLYDWLDQVAISLNLVGSLARGAGGQRLRGVFDHLKHKQFAMFRGELVRKLVRLGEEARKGGLSCGTVLEVGGISGCLYAREVPIGPFWG